MSYYFTLGQIPHKRHTQFRQPDGSLYHEELMGIRGFSGDKSLLYHLRPPTAGAADRARLRGRDAATPSRARCGIGCCAPRHLPPSGDAVAGPGAADGQQRRPHLGRRGRSEPMDYWYRYAHGDEVDLRPRGHRRAREPVRHAALRARRLPGDSDRRDLADRCRTPASTSACWSSRARAATSSRRGATSINTASFSKARRTAERDIRPPDALDAARRERASSRSA